MEELEIRQNVIALHNDLRTVNMPDQYKSLFVSILMLDEVEMLVKNDTEQLMADISCVIARRFSGEQAERISEKFTKSCTVSLIRERKSCEEYSLWWFLQQLQKIKSQLKETNMDAISLFYHVFLSYSSGGRNSLGIVLTPEHIADFMAKVINVQPGDSILDICCGTGALLNAASHYNGGGMLYGCERNEGVYDMASISQGVRYENMRLFHSDCYKLRSSNPRLMADKGLLNPPYAMKDHDELEFLLEELKMIRPHGLVAAIVPSKTAYVMSEPYITRRRQLLAEHTLKAVFSMPDDIFNGNGATAVTCIMVFEAHVPHDPSEKTFFGFFKDDGYKKKGKIGRIDEYGKWGGIRQRWLDLYHGNIIMDGVSTLASVGAEDEWLCEAYLRNDYSRLTEDVFRRTIRDYMSYVIIMRYSSDVFITCPCIVLFWRDFH